MAAANARIAQRTMDLRIETTSLERSAECKSVRGRNMSVRSPRRRGRSVQCECVGDALCGALIRFLGSHVDRSASFLAPRRLDEQRRIDSGTRDELLRPPGLIIPAI